MREPVPGVRIEVLDEADGSSLGEGVTDEKGQVLIDVAVRLRYIVRLDESTLPEGISAGSSGTEIAISAPPLPTFTTNFFTGERASSPRRACSTRSHSGWSTAPVSA